MRKHLLCVLIISFVVLSTAVVHSSGVDRALDVVPLNDSAGIDRRIALVIGNGGYKSSPLKNPVNDAEDISSSLKKLGFDVTKGKDMTRREMRKAIRKYGNDLKRGGVGLFYYSGHGMQVKGKNYLIPVGVDIQSEDEVEDEAIDAGMVLRKMESAGNAMNMVFLDACRDNPFARSFRTSQGGLAQMDAPSGSLIVYATAPGSVAADGSGRNGTFTRNLLQHLNTSELEVGQLLRKVRVSVKKETRGKQIPWESSSLEGSFYFVGTGHQSTSKPDIVLPPEVEENDDNFEKIAKERDESKAKWNDWQVSMLSKYSKNNDLDKGDALKSSEKVQMWDNFLAQYPTDNPYSTEDQLIRNKAKDRLNYWKAYKEPKPAIEKPHVVTKEHTSSTQEIFSKLYLTNTSTKLDNQLWSWTASIKGPSSYLKLINSVTYYLHPTFKIDRVKGDSSRVGHPYTTTGWGIFQLKAEVILYNGKSRMYTHLLNFN